MWHFGLTQPKTRALNSPDDMIQLELQDKFVTDLKIYYERQESVFGQLSAEDLEECGIKQDA